MTSYSVMRFFQHGPSEVIAKDLTLEEAIEHCNDPDTSSRTCTTDEGRKLTDARGPWFDGYVRVN